MTDKKRTFVIVEFEDGLQIVPSTWLSNDLQRCKWPSHYISNDRYDKAIKKMEIPASNWEEHVIKKIYATCRKFLNIIFAFLLIYFLYIYD